MAAFLIGQPDPNFKPRHQQVRTARGHPSGPALNQLAQGVGQQAVDSGVAVAVRVLTRTWGTRRGNNPSLQPHGSPCSADADVENVVQASRSERMGG